jgi:hypothetical protein
MNEAHDETGRFVPDPRLERVGDIFESFDRMIDHMAALLVKGRALIAFHQRMEDHLMDSLIEIASLGGPAGEVAAEALIVAWPEAGWDDNINVMLTDYARKITPAEWRRRKLAGDLNWPHQHQGLDGWMASCDQDHVEFEVRHDD